MRAIEHITCRKRRNFWICLLAGLLAACAQGPGESSQAPVVKFTPEALESFKTESAALKSADVTDVTLGVAGYANEQDIARFMTECEALMPHDLPKAAGAQDSGEGLSAGYGVVYHGKKPAPPVKRPPPGEFALTEGDPHYLDPNLCHESAGTSVAQNMFETLYTPAAGNTPPVPGAAERHEVSADGKTYTFHLRKGLTWSDGVPLTAHDFAYSWFRALNPKTESQNVFVIYTFVKGAKDYYDGKTKDRSTVGIRVIDDHTLEVELRATAPFFLDLLTYVAYAPVPRHAIEKHGKKWIEPGNIVVNGPYIMTYWRERDRIILEKNARYWDADSVAIKKATFYLSDREHKNLVLYKTGKVQAARQISNDKIKKFIQSGRDDLWITQIMCTYYYVIRVTKPPFDNPLLRRAINLAIDKEAMTKQILSAGQQAATLLVPPMFEATIGYKSPFGDDFNPPKARQLLAQAGYPGGAGLPEIEIIYNTYEGHRLIAEFVQSNLQRNLGGCTKDADCPIKVVINNMEWKSLLDRVKGGDYQIGRTSWCADWPDPTTFLEVLEGGHPSNYAGYKNPAYDALLDKIRVEPDRRTRNVMMCAAERVLGQDLPILPFYFYTRAYLVQPFVKGYEPQFLDHHLLKYISID